MDLDYQRKRGDTQCKCPFHGYDKHPSARIYDNTNSWYCFTCGISRKPIFFVKDVLEKPLTDVIYDYYKIFRADIIASYPELSGETFSLEEIKSAYLKSLVAPEKPSPLVTQVYSIGSTGAMEPYKVYNTTRDTWIRYYNSPAFLQAYFEFTNHINRVALATVSATDISNFNNFLDNLDARLCAHESGI